MSIDRAAKRWLVVIALSAVVALITIPALSGPNQSFGGIPDEAFLDNGMVDVSQLPDFIGVSGPNGDTVGYVASDSLFDANGVDQSSTSILTVVDEAGDVVGHLYPGRGFIEVGVNPDEVPKVPVTVYEGEEAEES